jgi:NAD(P)H-nitrite reductase large subunit
MTHEKPLNKPSAPGSDCNHNELKRDKAMKHMNSNTLTTWEEVAKKRAKALLVFSCDPKIRAWLEVNHPKALEQAIDALVGVEEFQAEE